MLPGNFVVDIPIEGVYSLNITLWDQLTTKTPDNKESNQDISAKDNVNIQILANGKDVTKEFVRFETLEDIKPTGDNVRTLIDVVMTTLEAWRGEIDEA